MNIELTTERSLYEQLGCFGYFGFGSGFSLGKYGRPDDTNDMYCNNCPLAQKCWDRHRERCREIYPDLTKLVDEIALECNNDPQAMFKKFCEVTNQDPKQMHEPYTCIWAGNVNDAVCVATDQPVPYRGPHTLTWPLKNLTSG